MEDTLYIVGFVVAVVGAVCSHVYLGYFYGRLPRKQLILIGLIGFVCLTALWLMPVSLQILLILQLIAVGLGYGIRKLEAEG